MTRYHRHLHSKQWRALFKAKKTKLLLVDRLTLFAAILEPLFTLPQVVKIFQFHDSTGVSILTWLGFDVLSLVWLWYGVMHREKLILVYQGLFFLFQSLIIIGGIIYGATW